MLSKAKGTRFNLPAGYISRDTPEYFDDVEAHLSGRIWQPEVYELAETMLLNRGCETVLDIGCGNGLKLQKLSAHRRIGVDFGSNINWCRQNHSWGIWIEKDLETNNADHLQEYLGPSTVVICSDVVEHLWNPLPLVGLWRAALDSGSILITSTPDRVLNRGLGHNGPPTNPAHVREWSLEEYIAFLYDQDVPASAAGWTINNDVDRALTTIVSFHDGAFSKERRRSHCPTMRFEALRPWLTGMKLMGGALAGEVENRILEAKSDISERDNAHSLGDKCVNGGTDAGLSHAQSGQRIGLNYNSVLERMILLATEVTSARAKSEQLERELVEVRQKVGDISYARQVAEDARLAAVVEIEQLRRELSERDGLLKVADEVRSVDARSIEDLRSKLRASVESLVAAKDAHVVQLDIIENLNAEIANLRVSLAEAQNATRNHVEDIRSVVEELSNKELQLTKERVRLAGLEAENCILRDHVWRMSSELGALPKRALAVYYGIRRRMPMQVLSASANAFDRIKPRTAK